MSVRSRSSRARRLDGEDDRRLTAALGRNPAVQTLLLMGVVSIVDWLVGPPFAISSPIGSPPWEFLAIYSHLSLGHLLSNAVIVLVAGGLVSLSTSTGRFHAFFVLTGVASSVAHVLASGAFGTSVAIIGSSGSAFALVGYLLVANPLSAAVFGRIDGRTVAVVLAVVAVAVTLQYSAAGSAVVSHFVGVVLGMAAGRFRLLGR